MKPTSKKKKKKSILSMETPCSRDLFSFQTVMKCQCSPLPAKEPAFDVTGGISGAKMEGAAAAIPWREPGGMRGREVIFILPHCGGCRLSAQCLQRDLSSLNAAAFSAAE